MITNDALYVVGGKDSSMTPTSTAYRLALGGWPTGTWTAFPSLPMPSAEGVGWCGPVSTGGSRFGINGGLTTGQRPSLSWQTTVTETCAV